MSSLPSYESVIAEVQSLVGPNPTVKDYIALANALPAYKKEAVTAGAIAAPRVKFSTEEKAALHDGMVKTLATDEAVEKLKSGARLAVLAAQSIEEQFAALLLELAKIDAKNQPPSEGAFGPRLETFRQEYRKALTQSKDLAIDIAVYGQNFDRNIIPLCDDADIPVEKRKEKIALFIAQADEFRKTTDSINSKFDALTSRFTLFIGSFSGWAIVRQAKLSADLIAAQKKLASLRDDLEGLTTAVKWMIGFEVLGDAAIALAFFCGPVLGSWLALGGLITSGLAATGGIGCAIGMIIVNSLIDDETERMAKLQNEKNDIAAARARLVHIGHQHLAKFKTNIQAIQNVWIHVHKNAVEVEAWLHAADQNADIKKPTYMKRQLEEGDSIYSKMAIYLEEYATGLVKAKVTDL